MGIFLLLALLLVIAVAALAFALVVARNASRPRAALPLNCGDCRFMVPRAKVYRRETLEDEDGIVHYLCLQRWIEVTPFSPRCSLGRSKTLTTTEPV